MPITAGSGPTILSASPDTTIPRRIHFGALRVLNDDTVAPGEGSERIPTRMMEIVSLVLSGRLEAATAWATHAAPQAGRIAGDAAGTGASRTARMNASARAGEVPADLGHHPTPRYAPQPDRTRAREAQRVPADRGSEGRGGEHVGWIHQTAWFPIRSTSTPVGKPGIA